MNSSRLFGHPTDAGLPLVLMYAWYASANVPGDSWNTDAPPGPETRACDASNGAAAEESHGPNALAQCTTPVAYFPPFQLPPEKNSHAPLPVTSMLGASTLVSSQRWFARRSS